MSVCLAVIAKAPVAGRVKTRLCPPCSPEQAAELATAALVDTLRAVAATPATRYVCVLDGAPGDWLPDGFEVIPQRGDGLDERLAAAFEALPEPTFLVGMDTPQVTPRLLMRAGDALLRPGTDAVLGHTEDGGYWGIGLRPGHEPRALFEGVPMSQDDTGAQQLDRLLDRGLAVDVGLPTLVDVDDITDARHVSVIAPHTGFATTMRGMGLADPEPEPWLERLTSVPR
ncbi:MAG: TIGR04282 family arsenosugar biosynthesis glycosyltransferase [Solirubrobacteraceae bacterium]|nr:glycosyltransferase [Patulibacter sp.]